MVHRKRISINNQRFGFYTHESVMELAMADLAELAPYNVVFTHVSSVNPLLSLSPEDRYPGNSETRSIVSTYQIFMVPNDNDIKQLVHEWAQAVRDGNMDGILARHTLDIAMFDVPMPLQNIGLDAYKKTWELFFRYSPRGEGSFELIDLKIVSGDTVAFCYALLQIGGQEPECRLTLGLQKINNKWYIVHEHHSAPFPIPEEK